MMFDPTLLAALRAVTMPAPCPGASCGAVRARTNSPIPVQANAMLVLEAERRTSHVSPC